MFFKQLFPIFLTLSFVIFASDSKVKSPDSLVTDAKHQALTEDSSFNYPSSLSSMKAFILQKSNNHLIPDSSLQKLAQCLDKIQAEFSNLELLSKILSFTDYIDGAKETTKAVTDSKGVVISYDDAGIDSIGKFLGLFIPMSQNEITLFVKYVKYVKASGITKMPIRQENEAVDVYVKRLTGSTFRNALRDFLSICRNPRGALRTKLENFATAEIEERLMLLAELISICGQHDVIIPSLEKSLPGIFRGLTLINSILKHLNNEFMADLDLKQTLTFEPNERQIKSALNWVHYLLLTWVRMNLPPEENTDTSADLWALFRQHESKVLPLIGYHDQTWQSAFKRACARLSVIFYTRIWNKQNGVFIQVLSFNGRVSKDKLTDIFAHFFKDLTEGVKKRQADIKTWTRTQFLEFSKIHSIQEYENVFGKDVDTYAAFADETPISGIIKKWVYQLSQLLNLSSEEQEKYFRKFAGEVIGAIQDVKTGIVPQLRAPGLKKLITAVGEMISVVIKIGVLLYEHVMPPEHREIFLGKYLVGVLGYICVHSIRLLLKDVVYDLSTLISEFISHNSDCWTMINELILEDFGLALDTKVLDEMQKNQNSNFSSLLESNEDLRNDQIDALLTEAFVRPYIIKDQEDAKKIVSMTHLNLEEILDDNIIDTKDLLQQFYQVIMSKIFKLEPKNQVPLGIKNSISSSDLDSIVPESVTFSKDEDDKVFYKQIEPVKSLNKTKRIQKFKQLLEIYMENRRYSRGYALYDEIIKEDTVGSDKNTTFSFSKKEERPMLRGPILLGVFDVCFAVVVGCALFVIVTKKKNQDLGTSQALAPLTSV